MVAGVLLPHPSTFLFFSYNFSVYRFVPFHLTNPLVSTSTIRRESRNVMERHRCTGTSQVQKYLANYMSVKEPETQANRPAIVRLNDSFVSVTCFTLVPPAASAYSSTGSIKELHRHQDMSKNILLMNSRYHQYTHKGDGRTGGGGGDLGYGSADARYSSSLGGRLLATRLSTAR
ncbi:hypothetical protein CBL_00485 [Carabus blaptoides fortunei]